MTISVSILRKMRCNLRFRERILTIYLLNNASLLLNFYNTQSQIGEKKISHETIILLPSINSALTWPYAILSGTAPMCCEDCRKHIDMTRPQIAVLLLKFTQKSCRKIFRPKKLSEKILHQKIRIQKIVLRISEKVFHPKNSPAKRFFRNISN